MAETKLRLRRRTPDAERLAWAKKTVTGLNGRLPNSRPEIYAQELIYLGEEPEVEIVLQAIRIGDLGITAIPDEVYGITGLKIKAQSPLQPTFNIELANGAQGYIPPPEQHALGGYTTWAARTAGLEVDAEPKIVDALLGLLEQVSGKERVRRIPPPDNYVQAVLDSKPNAFWRLDEMAGEIAFDASDNDHRGTYLGQRAFFLPGRNAGGLQFDEQTPNRAVYFAGGAMTSRFQDLAAAYSVEMWFWSGLPADARFAGGNLFCRTSEKNEPADHLSVAAQAGGLVVKFSNGNGQTLTGKTPITSRSWHHVVLVRDGDRVSVFLDGSQTPELTGEAAPRLAKGGYVYFAGLGSDKDHFEGKLEDVAFYLRPLAADEVARHFLAAGFGAGEKSSSD
jgi:hypothetical protein